MVEIPDAAIEAAAFESEIWRCACDRYRSGHDRAECDATARLMARAVLEAATVTIGCHKCEGIGSRAATGPRFRDVYPCEWCGGTGSLRVLRHA